MTRFLNVNSRLIRRIFTLAALTSVALWIGCSDDESNPVNPGGGTTSSSLSGAFVGSGDGGRLSVTIASATLAPALRSASLGVDSVTATGSLDPDGGSVVSLTGTYDTDTDTLKLTDGGYTLLGVFDSTGSVDGIVGSYAGPNGTGMFGCFVASAGAVQTSCGSFVNMGATVSGRWNAIILGDEALAGAVASGDDEVVGMEGVVTGTGNPRTITLAGEGSMFQLSASGSWDTTTNTITGTWETTDGVSILDTGTWDGSPCD